MTYKETLNAIENGKFSMLQMSILRDRIEERVYNDATPNDFEEEVITLGEFYVQAVSALRDRYIDTFKAYDYIMHTDECDELYRAAKALESHIDKVNTVIDILKDEEKPVYCIGVEVA